MIVAIGKCETYVIVACEEIAGTNPGDILIYQAFRTLFPYTFDLGYSKYYMDCAVLKFETLADVNSALSRANNFRKLIRKKFLDFLASPEAMYYLYKIDKEDYSGIVPELDEFYSGIMDKDSYYNLFYIPNLKDEIQHLINIGGDLVCIST